MKQVPPGDAVIPPMDVPAKNVRVKIEDETADTDDRATEAVPFIDLREKVQNVQCAGCAARAQPELTVEAYRQRKWLGLLRFYAANPVCRRYCLAGASSSRDVYLRWVTTTARRPHIASVLIPGCTIGVIAAEPSRLYVGECSANRSATRCDD